MTFPKANSAVPFFAATTDTTNSGAEVPKETTVKPTTKSEIFNRLASEEEPSTFA